MKCSSAKRDVVCNKLFGVRMRQASSFECSFSIPQIFYYTTFMTVFLNGDKQIRYTALNFRTVRNFGQQRNQLSICGIDMNGRQYRLLQIVYCIVELLNIKRLQKFCEAYELWIAGSFICVSSLLECSKLAKWYHL